MTIQCKCSENMADLKFSQIKIYETLDLGKVVKCNVIAKCEKCEKLFEYKGLWKEKDDY